MNERMTLAEMKEVFDAVSKPITPPQWIKCSERMPLLWEHVVFAYLDGNNHMHTAAGRKNREGFEMVGFGTVTKVTHWQPLPEPPND